MTKLSSITQSSAHHIVVFGDPKSGKSTLVSKLAEAGYKLTWVSIDNGHSVLWKLSEKAQENIDLIRLPDTRDFPVAAATCLKLSSGALCKICDAHGQVDCSHCKRVNGAAWSTVECGKFTSNELIIYDNISQLADSCMNFATEGKPDGYKSGYDEFRLQGFLMNKFLTNLQQSGWNSICIAHVCETEMEDGGKKLLPWIGSVPFSRVAGKYFDHMVYCSTRNKKHTFGSGSTYSMSAVTGSRTDVEIEKLSEASLVPIMKSVVVRERKDAVAKGVIEGVKESVKELAGKERGLVNGGTAVADDSSVDRDGGNEKTEAASGDAVNGNHSNAPEVVAATEAAPAVLSAAERAKAAMARLRR